MKIIIGIALGAILMLFFIVNSTQVSPESLRESADNLQKSQEDLAAAKLRLQKAMDQTCRQTGMLCK
jgi:hypothetical protein